MDEQYGRPSLPAIKEIIHTYTNTYIHTHTFRSQRTTHSLTQMLLIPLTFVTARVTKELAPKRQTSPCEQT